MKLLNTGIPWGGKEIFLPYDDDRQAGWDLRRFFRMWNGEIKPGGKAMMDAGGPCPILADCGLGRVYTVEVTDVREPTDELLDAAEMNPPDFMGGRKP